MNVHVAARPAPSAKSLLGDLRAALPDLAALGQTADADNCFPRDALRRLCDTGALLQFAPASCGGLAWANQREEALTLFEALRLVGRADLSLGRIFEGHVNAITLIGWYGTETQRMRLAADLAVRRAFGVWATEPVPGVFIEDGDAGPTLCGAKSFATGAGHIDVAIVTARAVPGCQLVLAAADQPRRTDASAWTMRGMKGTVSGAYDLTGLPATGEVLLGAPGDYHREPRFTAGAWRFTAVQLGGIERVLQLMREGMSAVSRGDPLARASFGDAVVATRTAGLWVREAALRAVAEVDDAVPFALMTRGVVERAGLDVMERAARVVGTRSFVTGGALDKATRDLGVYLRQAGPDHARDRAAAAWLDHDCWDADDRLW